MRHGKKHNHLGRKTAHRKALLMNLSNALIEHKRIKTTLAKAKALRPHVEPIINKCKTDSTHNRRMVFSYLQDKEMVKELFDVVAQKVADRPGGYTRVIKLGFRQGDAAEMAMIELVDFNEVYTSGDASKTKTRRSRRGKKTNNATDKAAAPIKEETATTEKEIDEAPAELDNPSVDEVNEMAGEQLPNEEANPNPESEILPEEPKAENADGTKDDLTVIEGVGPAIEKLLNEKGINTYLDVSKANADDIKAILDEAGSKFNVHDPSTWPQQATLLSEGKMDEFNKLTEELKGGKKVD